MQIFDFGPEKVPTLSTIRPQAEGEAERVTPIYCGFHLYCIRVLVEVNSVKTIYIS